MKTAIIDTNLIIRFLVNDDPKKAFKVENLLKDKNNTNFLLDIVVAEIIWVLSSYYELNKAEIIEKILALINVESIVCNRTVLNRALSIWDKNNISFIDAYIAAFAEIEECPVYSYDKKFSQIKNINRKEP